jgi:serine phosphatase RsbU (regulator of sigma subunit)
VIALLLVAIAVALFIRAHRQAARTTPDQLERARRVFVLSHLVACALLLVAGLGVSDRLFTPLVLVAIGTGLVGFDARARLIAAGTRRRDWILRGTLFGVATILLAVPGVPWVIGAVFAGVGGMAFRWKRDVPTRRLFAFGMIALALALIGFWRVGALPEVQKDALEGTRKALWEFANALRWSAAFFCSAGALAMLVQFVRDPSLGVQRVGRRLALSHVLVAGVPLLLMSLLWAATTLLGVSRERAVIAARVIESEGAALESGLRSALSGPGDPAPALRALGGSLERRIPGSRVWLRGRDGLVRIHGAPIAREVELGRWLDSLSVLNPSGVIARREATWVGAAVRGAGGAGIVLVPADSVRRLASRIAGTEVDLQVSSFRTTSNVAIDRDSVTSAIDSLVALSPAELRNDSLAAARVRRITRRLGVPDSAVQTDRNIPRSRITAGGETYESRRTNGPDGNPLRDGYAQAHGNSERRNGWGKSQALVRVSLPPGTVLAGLFTRPANREDQVALLPLILVSVLGIAFGLVALWDILMVASMGRGVADAIGALRSGARRLESGDLEHRIEVRGDDDLWEVARAFNQAAAGLSRARDAEQERARLENELSLARRIQARLLPAGPPDIAGLEIAGASESAREVGGDYFDHIDLGSGRVALVIADVSGKGVGAALIMSAFRASLVSHDMTDTDPAHLAVRLNGFLHHSVDPGKFVTAFVGFLDAATGALHYVNAGHNPPVLLRADGTPEWLNEGGTILGILPSSIFTSGVATLAPGDLLVLYTDGVTEGADARGEMWGEERLVATLGRLRERPCTAIVRDLVSEVRAFEGESGPADDITVLIARRPA